MPAITKFNDEYTFELRYKNKNTIANKVSTLAKGVQFEGNDPSAFLAGQPNSYISNPIYHGLTAITSSKNFYITGSLNVSGSIYSNEFHTNIVSSSIIFQDGDTIFGNSIDDTHFTTGSVYITSSLVQNITNEYIIKRPEGDRTFTILEGHITQSGDIRVDKPGTTTPAIIIRPSDTAGQVDIKNGAGDTVLAIDSLDRNLYFFDKGGEHIGSDGTDLTITSGNDIKLTPHPGAAVLVATSRPIRFGDSGEYISGDATDITIGSGNDIKLSPTTAVLIGTDKPIRFNDAGTAIYSSTDGQLDIDADGELEITSPRVDINASTGLALDGANLSSDWTVDDAHKINFRAAQQYIGSSATGQLDIAAFNLLTIVSPSVDINASTGLSLDGANLNSNWTVNTNNKLLFRDSAITLSSPIDGFLQIGADKGINLVGGHITASGVNASIANRANFSASGHLFASTSRAALHLQTVLVDTGSGQFYYTGSYGGGGGGVETPAEDATITLTAGDGLKTGGSFTTNQSSDATIVFDFDASDVVGTGLAVEGSENIAINAATDKGDAQHFVAFLDGQEGAQQIKTNETITYNPARGIFKVGHSVYVHVSGSVTASKNIWVSGSSEQGNFISSSNIISSGHITSSGNISASGYISASKVVATTFYGDGAGITGEGASLDRGSDARGDILYRGSTEYERLAAGTAGYALIMGDADPIWALVDTGNLAADAVTGAKIEDGAVDTEHIAADAIEEEHIGAGEVKTAAIADDAVTLDKMANIATGKIIYGAASNTPAYLTVGSSGQVLTVAGDPLLPSWADPAGGAHGADTQIQFNDGGTALGSENKFTYDKTKNSLLAGSHVTISNASGQSPIAMNIPNLDTGEVLMWKKGDETVEGRMVRGTIQQVVNQTTENYTTIIYQNPPPDGGEFGGKGKRGAMEAGQAAFVGSPGIFISSGSISFYTSSVTSSAGTFNTQSATIRMFNLKGDDGTSFVLTGSSAAKVYFSGSGKFGIGTQDPTNDVDIKTDSFKIRSKDGTKEIEFGEDGQLKTRKFSGVGASGALETTGSEVVMSYSPGTFDSPLKARAGDVMGSVRWEDESFGAGIKRKASTPMQIDGVITTATEQGISGYISFKTSQAEAIDALPVEQFAIREAAIIASASMYISDGFGVVMGTAKDGVDRSIIFNHATTPYVMGIDDSQDRFVIHQGTNFATDSTIEIGANMVVVGDAHSLNVAHYAAVLGGVHVGGTSDPGDDNLIVDGTTTLTGNVTASGNISGSSTTVFSGNDGIFNRQVTTTNVTASGNISASGAGPHYLGGDLLVPHNGEIGYDSNNHILFGSTQVKIDSTIFNVEASNRINFFNSNVGINPPGSNTVAPEALTVQGNISSSGNVIGANVLLPGGGKISFDDSLDGSDQFIAGNDNNITIDGDNIIKLRADHTIEFQDTSNNAQVTVNPVAGHITASGDISSSGTVTANALSVNGGAGTDDFFLIRSSSFDAIKTNSEGVMVLGAFTFTPTARAGGFYYDNSDDEFYLGKAN